MKGFFPFQIPDVCAKFLQNLSKIAHTHTHGLSRRSDGSLYCRCVLLCVNNAIMDWHERPQTSHTQTPGFVDTPALRLARLERSASTRLSSKSVTASWHCERQADLLRGVSISSRGAMPQVFRLVFRLSLYLLIDLPGRRRLAISCP